MNASTTTPKAMMLALAALTLIATTQNAHATGLMALGAQDWMNEGEYTDLPGLLPLESLDVTATMSEKTAQVTESRVYRLDYLGLYHFDGIVTFFRPLPHGDDASVVDFAVNGEAQFGTVLGIAEADALRRELVENLSEPGPLGDMGSPLFVSDPIVVSTSPWPGISVEFTVSHPTDERGSMGGIEVPIDWHKTPVHSLSVNVEVTTDAPVRALYGPYHQLAVTRDSKHKVKGSYTGYDRCTAFPVTILMSTGDEPIHVDVLPFRYDSEEGGHFMALITPDDTPSGDQVIGRDIVLVVDRSGSMKGEKMNQAKSALNGVLAGLNSQDSFAVVAFDTEIDSFAADAMSATAANVTDATAFVDGLQAGGSTNIYDALTTSFASLPVQTGHPRYVVLLTDGQPTAGETNTDAILDMAKIHNEIGARIFTFGIGYDVNTVLLDKLAMDSAGDALYITPGQAVDAAVAAFFAQLEHPVLTDPVLDAEDFGVTGLYPAVLTDLFAGQTTAVLGRYNKAGKAQLVLSGRQGDADANHVFDVTLPAYAVTEGYVPRIWATRHVGTLLQELKLEGDDPALIAEVMDVANRYGVVTDFTYFQVDEKGDTHMKYSPVPVAASGAVAVNTSSSIDGYQKGGTISEPVDTYVRYAWDRTLPTVGGWFTDTSLLATADWIDIHFGSEQHFALASAEASLGIGSFLAVARNVRFEHLGRAFRITDPSEPAGEELPEAAYLVPEATNHGEPGFTTVAYVGNGTAIDDVPANPTGQNPPPVQLTTDPPEQTFEASAPPQSWGCEAGGNGNTGWTPAMPWLLATLLLAIRMRRAILSID